MKYKTLIEEVEDDTNTWKDICVPNLEEFILLKWLYYLKQSTDLVQSLWKYPKHFFHRNRTDLLGNHKRPQIANENLRKGSKAGGIMLQTSNHNRKLQ